MKILPNVTVSCIGARQHYAVPRALHKCGVLKEFYTDIWAGRGWQWGAKTKSTFLKKYASRYHTDLADANVHSLWHAAHSKILKFPFSSLQKGAHEKFVQQGRDFSLSVNKNLRQQKLDGDKDFFLGFTSASLETLHYLREIGVGSVLDQIDPARVESRILEEERLRWPGWNCNSEIIPECYFERVAREWELASLILVNSSWTKNGLIQQGIAEEKIIVIPQAYENSGTYRIADYNRQRPLRVLWLGAVILRKGIQYLITAAKSLGQSVEIKVVGSIGIAPDKLKSIPSNMTFLGAKPRSEIHEFYRWADIYVLPTLSDGFAMTQLEALSYGVPIITTPNCGDVVTDSVEGFIVPIRDSDRLLEAIEKMRSNPDLVRQFSQNCLSKIKQFTLDNFGKMLVKSILDFMQK